MSIEQITSWLLLFGNCIQYWICVKKVQQKINKSYRNQQKLPVHKKTKNGHIYLFICSIASVTRNVLPFCEPKTIPRGFPSKQLDFSTLGDKRSIAYIVNFAMYTQVFCSFIRKYSRIVIQFRFSVLYVSFSSQTIVGYNKKDIVLKLRRFIIVNLRIYKISILSCNHSI